MYNFILLTVILLSGCSSATHVFDKKLQGTWIPIKQEINGKDLPKAVFDKQQLILLDTTYTLIAESTDKGIVRYNSNNTMDVYGKEGVNSGKHFTALYSLHDNELRVCYNLKGDNYPQSFDTKGSPLLFLSVFIKQQSQ